MSDRHLGVGIIGATGFFGKFWYVEGVKQIPAVQLVAVCARDQTKLAGLETTARRYSDYHDLLADPEVELVVVSTPDALHHPIVRAAAAAGKDVLCEKPLALTLTQARDMVDALEQAGRRGFVNFNYRFLPAFQLVAESVRSGRIGHVEHARIDMSWNESPPPGAAPRPWRLQAQYAGTQGILGDAGSHVFDMLRWLVGQPASLICQLRTLDPVRIPGMQVDNADLCLLQGRLANGTTFSSYLSRVEPGPAKFLQLHLLGSEGAIELSESLATTVRLSHGSTVEDLPVPGLPVDAPPPIAFLVARHALLSGVIHTLLNGGQTPALPTMDDGLRVQELIDAAQQSVEDHHWIQIPEMEMLEHQEHA